MQKDVKSMHFFREGHYYFLEYIAYRPRL
uniref:Uncharacterized protein n=1 Tax=Arundo donax TaxID=35708 RepID=A0A0A8Y967_ARUDO